jgi:hypothetical protein
MRKAVAIVLAWAALLGLWQLFVGQTTQQTTIAGTIAAMLAVGVGVLVARLGLYRFALDPHWLRRAATLPWSIVRDFGVVTLALLRGRPGGAFTTMDFPVGGDEPVAAGRRALVGLLGSVAPNAYVVYFDRERGAVLVHELDPSRSRGTPL